MNQSNHSLFGSVEASFLQPTTFDYGAHFSDSLRTLKREEAIDTSRVCHASQANGLGPCCTMTVVRVR